MKKIFTAVGLWLFPLIFVTPAFAQQNITICAGSESSFSTLCNLASGNFGKIIGPVISILFIIAVVIALFFLIVGGIKWITSGGDKAKVESARNTIVAAVVGLIIVFAAYFILRIVVGIFIPNFDLTNIRIPTIGQ
ncbi:MAG TPA: hypothetical protein VLF68_01315 [Candidatus Saccharimonadales bacterium]|nr:hypothetical protein [Candidatus Saccharimonadales bacterium]